VLISLPRLLPEPGQYFYISKKSKKIVRHEQEGVYCDSGRYQDGFRGRTRRGTHGAEKKERIWHTLVKLSAMGDLMQWLWKMKDSSQI
jgi:hypothetical protein